MFCPLKLTYKTHIDDLSLCPFLFAGSAEDECDDDAGEDAEDVEDGENVGPQTADHFGDNAHVGRTTSTT